jgi:hypothetical protein
LYNGEFVKGENDRDPIAAVIELTLRVADMVLEPIEVPPCPGAPVMEAGRVTSGCEKVAPVAAELPCPDEWAEDVPPEAVATELFRGTPRAEVCDAVVRGRITVLSSFVRKALELAFELRPKFVVRREARKEGDTADGVAYSDEGEVTLDPVSALSGMVVGGG